MDGHDPSDLSSFNRHVSDLFSDLTSSDPSAVLSLTWTRRLLDTFLIALEEFRFILQTAGPGLTRQPTDRFITDFFDRAVKSLDLCTAVRDGIERVRNWQKHVQIITLLTGPDPLREGPLRRARKAIGDLAIMMMDERDLPGSGSGSGFRNRSSARGANSKDHHHGHGGGPHHRRSSSGGGGSGSSSNGHFRYCFEVERLPGLILC
jgi:Protein BYPASS1-related